MFYFSQEQTFILFFIIGIGISILFDFFRAIRKNFRTSDRLTLIQDILFTVISGIIIIYSMIILNRGEVRFYLFIGILLGIIIYSLTIEKICVIILNVFVKICKKIIKIPLFCYKKVFNKSKYNLKKDF